jgi:hypothetical protein
MVYVAAAFLNLVSAVVWAAVGWHAPAAAWATFLSLAAVGMAGLGLADLVATRTRPSWLAQAGLVSAVYLGVPTALGGTMAILGDMM